jgi:DNA (cytosine-5)-methyltransferase 1
MSAPRVLDLFPGAGGATRGLQLTGLHVTAVDIKPQPHNPAERFILQDALTLSAAFIREFTFCWASPPCPRFSAMKHAHNAKRHEDLIAPTRSLLDEAGVPYAIENVVGAPLINPITLCGSMFDLRTPGGAWLKRHRLIETSFPIAQPPCRHPPRVTRGQTIADRRVTAVPLHNTDVCMDIDRPRFEANFLAAIKGARAAQFSEAT